MTMVVMSEDERDFCPKRKSRGKGEDMGAGTMTDRRTPFRRVDRVELARECGQSRIGDLADQAQRMV